MLSDEEQSRVDLTQRFEAWQDAKSITKRLTSKYAQLLDTPIDGEADDFLIWNAVDVVSTFADPAIEPDVEHICIAILILEGVASDIASANWDGLVEKAAKTLAGDQPTVVVCVRSLDLRQPELRARLYKFHGCAVKAGENEGEFRPYLVARQSQIYGWVTRRENTAMVDRLIDLIATKPTLMIGLSAQDANIQEIFAKAEQRMAWPWPGDRPSYVFSENTIGAHQQSLLRNVYRTAYTQETRQEIENGALFRTYAKPLLLSLVLHVLGSKLRKLIQLAPGNLGNADREALQLGVVVLRDQLAAAADGDGPVFARDLVDQSSRAMMMFRDGRAPIEPRPYNPITSEPIQKMAANVNLPASWAYEKQRWRLAFWGWVSKIASGRWMQSTPTKMEVLFESLRPLVPQRYILSRTATHRSVYKGTDIWSSTKIRL